MDTNCREKYQSTQERLLNLILTEQVITDEDVEMLVEEEELVREFTPADFEGVLACKYDPKIKIADKTVFTLVKFDSVFLSNRFVQDRIKEWQVQGNDIAKEKLENIGKCLYPSKRGPGQPESIPVDSIRTMFPRLHKRIKSFQQAFKQFKPGPRISNEEVRAKQLIKLCQLKKTRDRDLPPRLPSFYTKTREELEEESKRAGLEFEDLVDKLNVDLAHIKADFADCKPEWATKSPVKHADNYIAEIWSTNSSGRKPIKGNTVKATRMRYGIKAI